MSNEASKCSPDSGLVATVQEQEQFLWGVLRGKHKTSLWKRLRRSLRLGPEFQTRKHMEEAASRLQDLRQFLYSNDKSKTSLEELSFHHVFDAADPELTVPNDPDRLFAYAWELDEALKRDLLLVGDDHYLYVQLSYERNPAPQDVPQWRDRFGKAELDELLSDFKTGETKPATNAHDHKRVQAIRMLTSLYEARSQNERVRRTRLALRGKYLHIVSYLMGLFLLALLGSVVLVILYPPLDDGRSHWQEVLTVICAGGMGGLMSHLFRLRDELTRIRELFSSWSSLFAQPLIAAAAALIFLLMLKSRLIAFGGTNVAHLGWEVTTVLGFLAGFSEPFFLGTLDRLMGLSSNNIQPNKLSSGAE